MEKITLSKKNLILALLLQFFTAAGVAQTQQTFPSSGSFVVPAGVTSITVEAWGGGGKGGDRTSNGNAGGGGGGGYARKVVTVVPLTSYTVTVGAGSSTTAPGGNSWFGSATTVLAIGGNSVGANSSSGAAGGAASAYGDFTASGGNGATGAGTYGGGGGSGVGTSGTAANGSTFNGGVSPGAGSGGNGRSGSQGNGNPGAQPGGGGGGAYRTTSGTRTGGNGGAGMVVVTWTPEIGVQGNSASIVDGDASPSTLDSTDFGTTALGNPIANTYTIYNTGFGTLTLGAITFSGANAADFSIATPPATSLAPGASTSFVVNFNALNTGTRTATISIVNNDSDENPYNFSLQANVVNVEIDVQGNLTSIANNDATPSVADWTDFGTMAAVNGSVLRNFTIRNTGTTPLTIGTVTVSGANASDFTVTAQPAATVNGGSTTTFTVRFDPSSAGIKTATLSFANDDADENPFAFSIQGDATDPEMNLTGNSTQIVNGSASTSLADWTDFGSADITSGSITRTFTIENENIGNINLFLGAITISGANAGDFTVTTPPASLVLIGGTTTFDVTFDPSASGVRNATISIANNDSDESPYTFAISGTGTDPEINVQGNAVSIADGDLTPSAADWTIFGTTDFSFGTLSRTFTIENLGNATLTLGAITFTGANAADFSVTSAPAATIAAGGSTTLTVTFNPSAIGVRNAVLNIASDDVNENPYNFAVQGTGGDPEINVQGNAFTIPDGDTTPQAADGTSFGTTDIASGTITKTFTIQNLASGTAPLTISGITFTGPNAGDFSVTTAPASSLPINTSTTFVVTFNPSGTGVRTAVLNIDNCDSNENPYNFTITGSGADPEMNVIGNSISIVDGDTTPSAADFTSFGTTLVAGGTITRTFTIQNTAAGTYPLSIGAITFVGAAAGDFSVTTAPAASVAVNTSTTFVVTFNPSSDGVKTVTMVIANNDSNESPYDFVITGTGQGPEMDLQGNGTSITDGSTTPLLSDATDFGGTDVALGTVVKTYTIYNTGSLTLTLGAITISGAHATNFTVTTPLGSTSLAPGASTTFSVTFNPSANGLRSAAISIVNNDDNENPYNFNIQGTGESVEINVTGNSISIVDGSTSTSTANFTDFGSADITSGTVARLFYIQNTGVTPLLLSSITIAGLNPTDFIITSMPGMTIAGGSSAPLQVTFNPSALLSRNATIVINSNDYNEATYDFAISGYGYIDTDGDGIENTADRDDDNDGILDSVECDTCALDPFVNGSFETPAIGASTYAILPTSSVSGWQTSAENFIEIWSSGFNGVTAASGNQFAELNANVPGLLYQTFCLAGSGGTISWSVKHRARVGTDQAFVKFGPNLGSLSTIATMVDNTSAWGTYSGTYTIPTGQTQIILAFQAGYTGSGDGSIGNFIDDIQIIIQQPCRDTDGDGVANSLDLDSDNDGIPDVEEGLFKAYSNNLSKISPLTDANLNGVHDPIDAMVTANTYGIPDTDGDGTYDYLDLDSDNDAIFDVDESNLFNGDGDINGDGFGDGPDTDGDGILDLYDNNNSFFGTNFRPYATDTDGDGLANYREIDANFDGVKDILTTLYGSFDANLDGKIDGSVDADKDGILDTFDTKPTAYGSPRDLNRKLFLDFDGRNDYGEAPQMLSGLGQATIMCWIKLNATGTTGTIIGQDNFRLWFNGANNQLLATAKGGVTTNYATALNPNRWYHVCAVYDGSSATQRLKLYVNGRLENYNNSGTLAGALDASTAKFTIAKHPTTATQYMNASIDEIRVFNSALTTDMIQKMVYQEIRQNGTAIRGEIVPKDIESSSWANLIAYYRMDAYKDDVIDNYVTATIDNGVSPSFARIYNNKVISYQLAPMPFVTTQAGAVDAAVSQNNFVFGNDLYTYDWTILQMKHNINLAYNMSNLGLFVYPSVNLNLTNNNGLTNTWYLKLDGKIDLQGKSQLVQKKFSDLDPTSAGYIERDQQGTTNKWNYNYWSSPVGAINAVTNNNNYTVASVFKDGTNPANPQNITWTSGLNGSPTSPITLSSYWIFKFQNVTNAYANWATCGPNGTLLAGQGFTLKGSAAAGPTQNYVFIGKPNSGAITSPIAANNLNLSGNPYASAIDANQFITDNLGALTGALYFWEHYSTNTTHVLQDYQGGYAVYTLVGGTPPVAPSGISGLGTSTRTPKRFIPVGQGFFVSANTTGGSIQFNNGQRAFVKEDDVASNVMFRTNTHVVDQENIFNNNGESYEEDTYARLRIGFNSSNNYHRQLLLGYMDEHATSAIDPGYDAYHFDNQPNDMYFLKGSSKMNILGEGYFNINDVHPLGVKVASAGTVSFTLDGVENFDPSQPVYIHDAVTGIYHDIREEKFQIELPAGNLDNRFTLRFTGGTSLGTGEVTLENGIVVAYSSASNAINVKNNVADTTVESLSLYNMLGQSISTWDVEAQDQQNIVIPVKNLATGTYIVKMKTSKGDVSKKIIIK